ncbi:MAG: hypothetical protein NE327_06320 [Lentisphaeraceae bacterium]|nr:hypothetical protein [Lentisphaeraceae bacterium]
MERGKKLTINELAIELDVCIDTARKIAKKSKYIKILEYSKRTIRYLLLD